AAVTAAAVAAPQAPGEDGDLARRTLANAEQLLKEGKVEQALRDLDQIPRVYPRSDVADNALYRLGSYYYPAESVDDLGRAGSEAIVRAKDLFTRVKSTYPREDSAPRALIKLGLIALEGANPQRNLDEAYASFASVVNIYPTSDEMSRALFGAGYADFAAGKYEKAILSFESVAERFPKDPVAPAARFRMGMAQARVGAWIRALEEFQAVRTMDPNGPLAPRALDRLTQIYKLRVLPGVGGRRLFTHNAGYAPALDPNSMRGDVSLAVGPDNTLHVLDTRSGSFFRFQHNGKLLSTGQPMPGAVAVSVDDDGVELAAAKDRMRSGVETVIPTRQDGNTMRPFQGIAAAVRIGQSDTAVLDESRNEVLQYSGDAARLKMLYRDPEGRARLSGLAAKPDGRLYTIDKRSRSILEIAPASEGGGYKTIRLSQEATQAMQEPAALDVDDLGTLYVLDRRARAIHVMTTDGRLLETIASQQDGPVDFTYATAVAAGPRGEIYVYDERKKTVLRFW
ncbi:MAG: tetratricopeptide repeat protein, partial [Candidatus Polarisedimenticolia bacterium]